MAIEFKPYGKTTINDFIVAQSNEAITEGSISFKEVINDDVAIKFHNVITKYIDTMRPFIVQYTFSDEEYDRYKCKPNLLCYEIYNTPELAYSLLYINNMLSVTEFTRKNIKMFTPDINDVLKELMTLNKTDIERNRAQTGLR